MRSTVLALATVRTKCFAAVVAFALLPASAQGETLTLPPDHGGIAKDHHVKFYELRRKYDRLRVVSTCRSACTMIFAHWTKDQMCFGRDARVGFHIGARSISTSMMMSSTPPDINREIERQGGWTKKYVWFTGPQLWKLGYRKC